MKPNKDNSRSIVILKTLEHFFVQKMIEIYWDTCSGKGQLEKTRSWKVGKFGLKLESWSEVGKWLMNLKSFDLTWKESMKLESYHWSWSSIYKFSLEYSVVDSPEISPGSYPWDTNRTNRTRFFGGKYESTGVLLLSRTSFWLLENWEKDTEVPEFFQVRNPD